MPIIKKVLSHIDRTCSNCEQIIKAYSTCVKEKIKSDDKNYNSKGFTVKYHCLRCMEKN